MLIMPKLSIFLAWYDFWIGLFYDQKKKTLYFCPLPMVVIKFDWSKQMKAKCKCYVCDEEIEVDFVLEPTEEDKLGFVCEVCYEKQCEEHGEGFDFD